MLVDFALLLHERFVIEKVEAQRVSTDGGNEVVVYSKELGREAVPQAPFKVDTVGALDEVAVEFAVEHQVKIALMAVGYCVYWIGGGRTAEVRFVCRHLGGGCSRGPGVSKFAGNQGNVGNVLGSRYGLAGCHVELGLRTAVRGFFIRTESLGAVALCS